MKEDRARVLTEGLVAGVLGYAVVAVLFAVLNVLSGRHLLHTAALLGGLLTGTEVDPASPAIATGPVLAYNAVHLVVFLAVGTLGSTLLFVTERHTGLWELFLLIFVAALMVSGIVFGILVGPVSAGLAWWAVIVANAAAAVAMGGYLLGRHPGLRGTIDAADV